jgi:glycine/D-amino acid oxidase-like deaminating enzyme
MSPAGQFARPWSRFRPSEHPQRNPLHVDIADNPARFAGGSFHLDGAQGSIGCVSAAEARDAKIEAKTRALSRKLAALLPSIGAAPVQAWAGSFGDSAAVAQTIGRIPGMANCQAAIGYGGNGIKFSMLTDQMLRGLITGNGDADSDLVSFHRDF